MTPFLQFRIWFRRATTGQRASASMATAALVALVAWTAVPSGPPGASNVGVASGATASGGPGGGGPGGPTQGSAAGPAAPTAAVGPSPTTSVNAAPTAANGSSPGGPQPTPGTNQGGAPTATSPSQVQSPGQAAQTCTRMGTLKIGVALPNEAGGQLNTVFGIPSQSEEQADYAAVFDAVNKAGGVDCNLLSGLFMGVDGTNPSTAQSDCLTFAQDHVFAVLGGFLPAAADDCLMQHHLPTFEQIPIPAVEVKQYYPYYFSIDPTFEVLYRNFVDAVKGMGYLSSAKGFAKLGIFYRDCIPSVNSALLADFAAAGVSGGRVDTSDLGCPSGPYATPSAVQQAILKFKTDGVTTVTVDNDYEDIQQISSTAQKEGFHPRWLIPDTGVSAVSSAPEFKPDPNNFDGALAITPEQYGAIESALPETPGTVACDKIMSSHGLPTVYKSPDQYAGSTCSLTWMLVAAIQHAGLNQSALAAGLQAAKSTQYSFPDGPNDFSGPGTTTGGQYWRPITYSGSCGCWKVQNATWSPSFQ